jgi:hypothetical protein
MALRDRLQCVSKGTGGTNEKVANFRSGRKNRQQQIKCTT